MRALLVIGALLLGNVGGIGAAAPRLPGLPTQLLGGPSLVVRPAVVDFTGDGSGFLGSFDGSPTWDARSGQFVGFGHFAWTVWTPSRAVGSGAVWVRTCWVGTCEKHRYTAYPAKAYASRPRDSHFMRLAIVDSEGGKRLIDCRTVVYISKTTLGPGYYTYGPSFHCTP